MKHIQDYRTLAILFSPGIGGNHLANLISTSLWVNNRVTNVDDYNQHLLNIYKNNRGNNFHADEFTNFGVEDYNKAYELVKNNTVTTVLPGHIEDAFWVLNHIKPLGKIGFITFEVFDINLDEFYKKQRTYIENYNPYLYRFLYNKDVVGRILDIADTDGHAINASSILSDDITILLTQLNDELQLELDIDFCNYLHKLRFNKLF